MYLFEKVFKNWCKNVHKIRIFKMWKRVFVLKLAVNSNWYVKSTIMQTLIIASKLSKLTSPPENIENRNLNKHLFSISTIAEGLTSTKVDKFNGTLPAMSVDGFCARWIIIRTIFCSRGGNIKISIFAKDSSIRSFYKMEAEKWNVLTLFKILTIISTAVPNAQYMNSFPNASMNNNIPGSHFN